MLGRENDIICVIVDAHAMSSETRVVRRKHRWTAVPVDHMHVPDRTTSPLNVVRSALMALVAPTVAFIGELFVEIFSVLLLPRIEIRPVAAAGTLPGRSWEPAVTDHPPRRMFNGEVGRRAHPASHRALRLASAGRTLRAFQAISAPLVSYRESSGNERRTSLQTVPALVGSW